MEGATEDVTCSPAGGALPLGLRPLISPSISSARLAGVLSPEITLQIITLQCLEMFNYANAHFSSAARR